MQLNNLTLNYSSNTVTVLKFATTAKAMMVTNLRDTRQSFSVFLRHVDNTPVHF